MSPIAILAAGFALAQVLIAGPLDENRAGSLASDHVILQTRPWRVAMFSNGRWIGFVDLVGADGDIVQLSVFHGEPMTLAWSELPATVQKAFAEDRVKLLAPTDLPLDEVLKRTNGKGILGRVVKKLPEGVLVTLGTPDYRTEFTYYGTDTFTVASRDITALSPEGQVVLVRNLPGEASLGVNDKVNVVGFLVGAAQHNGRAVPVFSATLIATK